MSWDVRQNWKLKMTIDLKSNSTLEMITEIVDQELGTYGQFVCNIDEGNNTWGDPSYFIEVCFDDLAQRVPAKVTVELRSKLRTELLRIGDGKFPYFSYNFESQLEKRPA
jgi:hypothetical protein